MKHKFLLSHVTMDKNITTFGKTEIKKHKFQYCTDQIFSEDVDVAKTLSYSRVSSSGENYKYFIGYKNLYKNRPLSIIISEMRGRKKTFGGDIRMFFLMEDDKLLKKYNKIWNKVENSIIKEFDSEPVE